MSWPRKLVILLFLLAILLPPDAYPAPRIGGWRQPSAPTQRPQPPKKSAVSPSRSNRGPQSRQNVIKPNTMPPYVLQKSRSNFIARAPWSSSKTVFTAAFKQRIANTLSSSNIAVSRLQNITPVSSASTRSRLLASSSLATRPASTVFQPKQNLISIENRKRLASLNKKEDAKTFTARQQVEDEATSKKEFAENVAAKDVTYLYQKLGANGEHLKFGITKNPATRYTQEQLAGGRLKIIGDGAKKNMLQLERNLHETLPIGPQEGQSFYIQKQVEKGLSPPPYNPSL